MKKCQNCGSVFEFDQKEKEFLNKLTISYGNQDFPFPDPGLCHLCRWQKELCWRNPTKIYRRKCDLCKKDIISQFSPDKPNTVYCRQCFWSDNWSAIDYGHDFDFDKTFSDQFNNLIQKVPLLALININAVNSDFCNVVYDGKDNYYSFIALYNPEGLINTYYTIGCKYSVDISVSENIEWSYELVDCQNCYQCFYSRRLNNCRDCFFCEDLIGCHHCFGCKNLINASYCVYNKRLSEKDYQQFINDAKIDLYSSVKKHKIDAANFFISLPNRSVIAINCENSSGTYLNNDKNCIGCFALNDGKDNYYLHESEKDEYCYSCTGAGHSQFSSYCAGFQDSNNCHCCVNVTNCNNLLYCYGCYPNSSYSFGCVGLKNNIRCIFNKEYSDDEYEKQVIKIIRHMQKTGEWGKPLLQKMSPFGYNESAAFEHFPLSKPEAIEQGYNYCDYESPFPQLEKVVEANQLPEDTESVTDKITSWAIRCQDSNRLFRLTPKELEFYRKFNIPIPRKHPDIRHINRLKLRIPIKNWSRKCGKCNKDIMASYPTDSPLIIYCQDCYNKEIV